MLALCVGQRAWPGALAARQLDLGLCERSERPLPVALQPARDEPVLGLDLAVAALGALRLITGALDLQPPLPERLIVVGLERLGGDQRGLHARRGERGEQRAGDRRVDPAAADPQTPATAALGDHRSRAVVAVSALAFVPS